MLGLGFEEWGETDVLLTSARRDHDRSICPCGCGQWSAECMDEATAGRWQVEVETCYARDALAQFQKRHEEDLTEGTLLSVRLLAEGEEPIDPLVYDPAAAARRHAEHAARFGLNDG